MREATAAQLRRLQGMVAWVKVAASLVLGKSQLPTPTSNNVERPARAEGTERELKLETTMGGPLLPAGAHGKLLDL